MTRNRIICEKKSNYATTENAVKFLLYFSGRIHMAALLTYFQNSFIVALSSKFVMTPYLNIPLHLRHVATLPCEISIQKIAKLKK